MSQQKSLEELFRHSLDGYQIKPSKQAWKGLERQLFWKDFFRFSFQSLNAYYSGAVLLVSLAGVFSFFQGEGNVERNRWNAPVGQSIAMMDTREMETALLPDAKNIPLTPNIPAAGVASNIHQPVSGTPSDSFDSDISREGTEANGSTRSNSGPLGTNSIAEHLPEENERAIFHERQGSVSPAGSPLSLEMGSNLSLIPSSEKKELSNLLNQNESFGFNTPAGFHADPGILTDGRQMPEEGKSPADIIVYDTIFIYLYDTVRIQVVDTIHSSFHLEIPSSGPSRFSIEMGYSPFITSSRYSASGSTSTAALQLLQKATTSASSFSAGAFLNYHLGNWIFQSGLSFTRFREDFDEKLVITQVDSMTFYSYEPSGGYYETDTTEWTFIYDQVGNAFVQVPVIEHFWNALYDSTLRTYYNISSTERFFRSQNTYSFVEIPFNLRYAFQEGPFRIEPAVGISLGFLSGASGKTIGLSPDPDVVDIDRRRLPFRGSVFSVGFGLGLHYRLNERMWVTTEPFYRQSLQSIYEDSHLFQQHFRSTGIKVGIRYRF